MGDMDDLIREFLVESYENLDQLDRDFVALETDPTATEKLGSIFRTIHTIKGTCGCLGFGKLESVAHVGENLLTRLRDGQLVMNKEITTALLQLVDAVREILSSIETTGSEGDKEYSAVKQKLITLNEQPASEPVLTVSTPITPTPTPELADAHDDGATDAPATPRSDKPNDSVAANAIRVDVVLLDKLMNLVGELVLARNQVLQYNAAQRDSTFLGTAQRLNLITTELQEGVMKTRMQPIGNLWNKFPRIVRDVANACNKKVRIEMEGRETELDKTILEAIKDPLTHVIRNSVDHGVESPDKRRASNKPEEGRLFLRAFHEGGQVNIEITDDGKGIDADIVKRKAVERGLITAEQATRMSEREAINLIFQAGFSTAEKVTNVSGRGVGMDVVKTNVEKIGGTVDIKSRAGHGTTLRIKIPLTLAIIPALIVTSAGERFAIPQVSLLELVRIEENETGIEFINGTPIYRLRGNLLPLVYLNQQLGLSTHNDESRSSHIVVLRGGERQFGLVVDQINDTEEIVVKPLGKQLKGLSVFAGATIMGDGGVALILDVMGLAQRANVISQAVDSHTHADTQAHNDSLDCQTLLLFTLAGHRRMAIPLSLVARLEEIPRNAVEDAAGQAVVQYRGQIMPLLNLAEFVGTGGCTDAAADENTLQIIVHNHEGRNIGLRVEHILDVVEERVSMQRASNATGLMGSAVIKEKVTGLIDVRSILESAGELSAAA